jgi:RHS repeat-associated protein
MRKSQSKFFGVLFSLVFIYCLPSPAQVVTGTPPLGSFGGGPDVINLANLNSHIVVPVRSKPGRGGPFVYNLSYDTSVWNPVKSGATTTWQPATNWGWTSSTAAVSGHLSSRTVTIQACPHIVNIHLPPVYEETIYDTYWTFYDYLGTPHGFPGYSSSWTSSPCGSAGSSGLSSTATDGSGYSVSVTSTSATVTTRKGTVIGPPANQFAGPGTLTDRNGNIVSVDSSGNITDTLGTIALVVAGSGTPSSPITFTYAPPAGGSVSYTMKFTAYTVQTNFGCSGIGEYSAANVPLVSEIDSPDGTNYLFTYETTPGSSGNVTGRLASVTAPTGGTVSYAYSGGSNGITCADGSTATLSRQTPDGSWTYAHSESGTAWTTTITDPQLNQSVLDFQGTYETERQVYQGSTSGTLLETTYTCYNGAAVPCNSTAITLPIASRANYVKWPEGLESETNTDYNAYGSVTENDWYAYGAGAPGAVVRKTLTTYASLGNGIVGLPASVTIVDGSSNVHSNTTFSYDQTAVTATSGTPQQAAITGSRGNATTISYLAQGSTSLNKIYTYYDTGNVSTATDVNGAVTSYSFGSGTSCGNSFVTSVTEPLSLSRSMVWNCTGGVQTSGTDENGQTTITTYGDSYFWRPTTSTDAALDIANFTYTAETSAETYVNFNGSTSTKDALNTVDTLGRAHISQRKQGQTSSTYDSVETDYDSLGRPSRTTLPYAAGASTINPTAPSTNTTYDALSRKIQVTDNDNRTITYAYTQNDTYRTLGPAPTGENTKRKQSEYDALGRMTSVCEVTSATGSGTCAQTSTATGYWTTYSYDVLNDLAGVTQNAQSSGSKQTRSYTYDDLGRMTSETNPEAATTTYTYDTDSTCGTYKGDLVKKIDAVGNTTCYAYDSLHRITSTRYSGPYSTNTPTRYFVYDGATVNGVAMANAKTRMAEAYTCVSPCSTKITDLGFSYTVLGQPTDVYESTPNSGSYYHVTGTYYANGALNQLSNLVGLPTITYGVDGEGRVNSASASSGQNPLTSTSYNPASLPTQVNLGSSDSDSFTYDPNSNRMMKYTFAVNGQSVVGSLTWSAIATLETVGITDPFYSGGNQTCNYAHDDMSRVTSANCGSPWAQSFSYDAFGNITKSGSSSFQPTYSYVTNHMTEIGGSTPTYDANGNVTNDFLHTYTWDATGRPVIIDGVGVTYDALGRMVERDSGGTYTQVVYAPTGGKLALMSGQTLSKAFVSLSGGAVAVYNSSGLAYYRHPDWLGSSRFASTPARALYFDGANAPFGENYAQTGTTDLSFTGMNQDTVSNLFDFPAREYNAIQGRWPSPDPKGISSVRTKDPQTWNRYAYVRNNPLKLTDPTGESFVDCPAWTGCGTGGGNGGGGGGGGGGGCMPGDFSCDPFSGGSCTADACGDETDDNSNSNCDADCQNAIAQAAMMAEVALEDPGCAQAVAGGSGAATATLEGDPLFGVADFSAADLGDNGPAIRERALPGSPSVWGGNRSAFTFNTNSTFGFLNGFVDPYSYDIGSSQMVGILHDLGHAAVIAGLSSVVQDDSVAANGSQAAADSVSFQNSQTIAAACPGPGDGDMNQGLPDQGSEPVAAAKRKRKHF